MAQLRVKLLARGKALTPYIAKVTTNGRVQKAFATQIGLVTGACVRQNVRKGMTQTQIRRAVKECAPVRGAIKLNL